jgi:hypothetical protein
MGLEIVTKEDLQMFRIQLLDDIKRIFSDQVKRDEQPERLKSKEVRMILKISPGSLQNLRIAGKLNPVKIQGTWYYSLAEVNGLFKKGGCDG